MTIADDDATPTITLVLDPASINENGGFSIVSATLNRPSSEATEITVAASHDLSTGVVATDYTLTGTTLTIAAGTTFSTGDVRITANDNDGPSSPESKQVTVSAASTTNSQGFIAPDPVTLTITDAPAVTLVLTPASISENGGISSITATLSRASTAETTLDITATPDTSTGADTDDYDLPANLSLTIAAGTTTSSAIMITAMNNDVDAPNKEVTIAATNVQNGSTEGVASPAAVTLTIEDDDDAPTVTLRLDPASINEDGGISRVSATLNRPSSAATILTVNHTPSTGATAGDYTPSTNLALTIPAGATASTGDVTITASNNDNPGSPTTKMVTISATATNTQGVATSTPADVTLTITDAPAVTLVLASPSIAENGGNTTITATLSSTSTAETTIIVNATSDTGTDDGDYTLVGTTMTIPANATTSTGTVTITAVNNNVDSPNKTVTIAATAQNGSTEGVAGPAAVTLIITDDDAEPTVTLVLTPASINEDGGISTVTATLSHPSSEATTLAVNVTPSPSATASDYTVSTNTALTFAAGDTTSTGTVTITAEDNAVDATNKTITVSAIATNTHGITAPVAVTLTLTDDDQAPTAVGQIDQQTVFFPSGTPGDTVTLAVAQYFQASGVLTYTATSDPPTIATVAVTGAGSSTMLTITSVAAGSADITVTATDGVNPSVEQPFTVQIVGVTAVDATASNADNALVLNDVGGVADNDVRLTLPSGHMVTTITVMTYDPLAATVADPPNGVTFSGVAVDIELDNTKLAGNATVCLSTVADASISAGRRAVLYHLPDSSAVWNRISEDTAPPAGFVCGTTAVFSPFAIGYAAVANTARLNEKILTRTSQAITAGTLAAVAARVEAAAGFSIGGGTGNRAPKLGVSTGAGSGGSPNPAYQFGGQSSLRGLLQAHGQAMLQEEMNYSRLLDGASFVIPLSAAGDQSADNAEDNSDHNSSGLSLWGGSDYRSLGSDEDSLNWDGEILSTHLGIDGWISEKVLAGVALSWNRADFDFLDKAGGENSSGDYQYRSTNLHPYFGWLPSDNLKVWASAGIGQGEIEIEADENAARSTDTAQWSLGGGFNHRLLGWSGLPDAKGALVGSSTTLHFKGDIALTQVAVEAAADARFAEQDIGSQRVRLLLSGEQRRELASGGAAMPSVEVGVRIDAGDGESASGLEIGTGLRYVNPDGKLAVSGNIRGLLSDKYDEFGADVMLRLSPPGGRGLSLSVNPVWGKTQSVAEQLWDDGVDEVVGELGDGDDDGELQSSLVTEVGYGVGAMMLGSPGLLTPYVGMTADEAGIGRLRLGSRFVGGNGLSLNLEGAQRNTADGANHTVLLRGELAF